MSPIFVKKGVTVLGTSLNSVPKEFLFPYTTEDPDEIAFLVANGAKEAAPVSASPKKTPAAEGEGE